MKQQCGYIELVGQWCLLRGGGVMEDYNFEIIELLELQNAELLESLEKAKQFIENGIELGYIRMPDLDTPDSAHDTLPIINAAIAKARGQ